MIAGCNSSSDGGIGTTNDTPSFAYDSTQFNYHVGSAITPLDMTLTGDGIIKSFSIDPDLQSQTGLTFNTSTGEISGKPTKTSDPTFYAITGTGPGGQGYAAVYISVTEGDSDIAPEIQYGSMSYSYHVGTAITTSSPMIDGDGIITSFSIEPDLQSQTGLIFNTSTGAISGKPTKAHEATAYVITATGPGGQGSTVIGIAVTQSSTTLPPEFHYSDDSYSYTLNTTISSNKPTDDGEGTITSYSISPDLQSQTGLTFSTSTGTISGKPTKAHDATDYTVTAHGPGGTGTATINIEVDADKSTLLTAHTWTMTKATVSPSIKIGSTSYTNIFSLLDDCGRANTIKFNTSGSATDRTGSTGCSSGDPSSTTDSWSLNSSQTVLTITSGGHSFHYNITTLTETSLVITSSDLDYGDDRSHTTTLAFTD